MAGDGHSLSPELRVPVKVTYTGRMRRNRRSTDIEGGRFSSDESDVDAQDVRQLKSNAATTARLNGRSSPSPSMGSISRGKRKNERLDLPGPAPRTKKPHRQSLQTGTDGSPRPRSEKPLSSVSSKLSIPNLSARRCVTPDHRSSPSLIRSPSMDSVSSQRLNEEERQEYFRQHPNVAEVEPHRVLCKCCGKWLKLHSSQRYAMSAWKAHGLLCTPSRSRRIRSSTVETDGDAPPPTDLDKDDNDDAHSVAHSAISSTSRSHSIATSISRNTTTRTTVEDRLRTLETDELIAEVRESEVFCEPCKKWVRLSVRTKYSLVNWRRHTERVHGRRSDAPSKKVKEAERKLQLVNDSNVREFASSWVVCKVCDTKVQLSEKVPYDLENWIEHKTFCAPSSCSSLHQHPLSPSSRLTAPSLAKSRPPLSTASTDTYVNATADNNVSPSTKPQQLAGTKRRRSVENEDTHNNTETANVDTVDDNGQGPSTRARTEFYVVPDAKPPVSNSGTWGWFWLPWETFKRGFAEGIWAKTKTVDVDEGVGELNAGLASEVGAEAGALS